MNASSSDKIFKAGNFFGKISLIKSHKHDCGTVAFLIIFIPLLISKKV
jgi:hypothetical protein